LFKICKKELYFPLYFKKARNMPNKIKIENLDKNNIEELLFVCSWRRMKDPVHREGMRLKRAWLSEMLDTWGSVAKIAYYQGMPRGQILYFPEEADKARAFKRKNVLWINCVYNPFPKAQRLGIGRKLVEALLDDCEKGEVCGLKTVKYVLAKAFNTGEALSLPEFYRKMGFAQPPGEGDLNALYMPISGEYEKSQSQREEYVPLPEDRNKAVVFYSPICQFSYPFALRVKELVREVAPGLPVEMINEWERPEEAIKRKNHWLIVNATPIHTFFMAEEQFKREVKQALEAGSNESA
jgi:GNAT superfamily N-acetyltransferase